MSRLANLLIQVSATSHTQEKLGATYFDHVSKPLPPPPRHRGMLLCGIALMGICAGLLLATIRFPSWWKHQSSSSSVYPLLTFDDATARELLGRQFGLWWGVPGHQGQSLTLALDAATYVGSSGQSLRIDYALSGQSGGSPPLGVWFLLPTVATTRPYQLEFQIRGDERAGYTRQATLELRHQSLVEQHPFAIGSAWATVRVPLTVRVEPHGRLLSWHEFRILFDGQQVTAMHGRVYIDQIQLTTATP